MIFPLLQSVSRRRWLQFGSSAFGSLALAALTGKASAAARQSLALRSAHAAPRAKHVIFLFMNGGPSQVDMLDYKPELNTRDGQQGRNKKTRLLGSHWSFSRHGQSGMWISELLPNLARQSDRLCVINSMQTDSSAHPLAIPLLHTGSFQFTRPSMGSWILYGLGTDNQDLPGFITVNPTRTFGGPSNYGSAFLPTAYQATRIGWQGGSLKNAKLENVPSGKTPAALVAARRELTQTFNQSLLQRNLSVPQVTGAIESLQLSTRMEQSMPSLMDLGQESKETLALYGVNEKPTDNFARQCLLARRFVEAGVRFVELTHGGWDHHSNLSKLNDRCANVDRPMAALLEDLDRRGLLDETLVVWSGEFGREPEAQILADKIEDGRNHNAKGFTVWLAGGGVRSGLTYGATDELGYEAVENKVHLYDLQATILHLLGLDHTKLTYRYSGRDFRLTDVHGKVAHDIIA